MMRTHVIAITLVAGLIAACDQEDDGGDAEAIGLANPASVFCVEQGGKSEIRTHNDGNQTGICVLPDGQEVDEWAYFREHNPDEATDDGS